MLSLFRNIIRISELICNSDKLVVNVVRYISFFGRRPLLIIPLNHSLCLLLFYSFFLTYLPVHLSLLIPESTGPEEWLINLSLPVFRCGSYVGHPIDDMVVVHHELDAWEVYDIILSRASETIGCDEFDLLAFFDKRTFDYVDRSIQVIGFFNCCTVNVEVRNGWGLYVDLPRLPFHHPLMEAPLLIDPRDSCNVVNSRVLTVASSILLCDRKDLYVLFNGTPLRRCRSAEICLLGLRDGSHVTVHYRLRGGVCIAQRTSGRKRSVGL